jgi:DNA-binding transcriptional ArsR family regulator
VNLVGGMPPHFVLERADAIVNLPPMKWFVEGVLPEQAFAVLFGAPGDGKSFISLDLSLCIAAGIPWHGRQVQKGAVVYVVAEGSLGVGKRVAAWLKSHGIEQVPDAFFVRSGVQLHQEHEVAALMRAVSDAGVGPALFVMDTLAQCFVGGDENAAQSMGVWVQGAQRLQKTFRAAVLAIHHSGKKGDSERGSTALRGAADTIIRLKKSADAVTLTCSKQKEAEPFKPISLKLVQVQLPTGSSLVVQSANASVNPALPTGSALKIARALAVVFTPMRAKELTDSSGVSESTLHRHLKTLVEDGLVEKLDEESGGYALTAKGRQMFPMSELLKAA